MIWLQWQQRQEIYMRWVFLGVFGRQRRQLKRRGGSLRMLKSSIGYWYARRASHRAPSRGTSE